MPTLPIPPPRKGEPIYDYNLQLQRVLQSQRLVAGPGISITQSPGSGVVIATRQAASATSNLHPFKVTSSGSTAVKVRPGTINSLVPTNILADLTITGSGTEYIVLTLTTSEGSPTSAALSVETDYPVPSLSSPTYPPTTAKDVIAVLVDGTIYQVRNDNLTATSTEVFQETVDSPEPGARDYIPWYRWEVA